MYRIKPTDIVSKSNVKADVNREDKISSFITYKRTYMYVMMWIILLMKMCEFQ